jgi:ParB-like chromosome segregation protein Spo0J
MQRLDPHPLARLFPPMTPEEYAGLQERIRQHGLREPVTLHRDGRILDGVHREKACRKLGIPVRSVTFKGTDAEARAFVFDRNLHRRHLTPSQRAMAAAEMANMPAHRPINKSANFADFPGRYRQLV